MKKRVLTCLLTLGLLLPLNAKSTTEVEWSYDSSEARMLQGDAHLYVRPFVVDLQLISQKRLSWRIEISDKDYASRLCTTARNEIDIEATQFNMQTYAVYLASTGVLAPFVYDPVTKKENPMNALTCDVIVAPLFNMQFDQNHCVIEFTGYPAVYSDWKSATLDEYERWIKFDRNQTQTKTGVQGTVGVEEREVRVEKTIKDSLKGALK